MGLPAFLCTVLIFTFANAASKSQEPNRCNILLHLGLLGASGSLLSNERKPGKHCGAGVVDLDVAAAPFVTEMNKPFPNRQILDSSEWKQFADDNFKFDENGRKFAKQVENTVGKGEIVCHGQFSHLPSVFKRLV